MPIGHEFPAVAHDYVSHPPYIASREHGVTAWAKACETLEEALAHWIDTTDRDFRTRRRSLIDARGIVIFGHDPLVHYQCRFLVMTGEVADMLARHGTPAAARRIFDLEMSLREVGVLLEMEDGS